HLGDAGGWLGAELPEPLRQTERFADRSARFSQRAPRRTLRRTYPAKPLQPAVDAAPESAAKTGSGGIRPAAPSTRRASPPAAGKPSACSRSAAAPDRARPPRWPQPAVRSMLRGSAPAPPPAAPAATAAPSAPSQAQLPGPAPRRGASHRTAPQGRLQ